MNKCTFTFKIWKKFLTVRLKFSIWNRIYKNACSLTQNTLLYVIKNSFFIQNDSRKHVESCKQRKTNKNYIVNQKKKIDLQELFVWIGYGNQLKTKSVGEIILFTILNEMMM